MIVIGSADLVQSERVPQNLHFIRKLGPEEKVMFL